MWQKIVSNFQIAMDAVLANRLRSILTALGIIFGVAAVIAMLAIGNGAQQEILDQIKLVGVNNIVITPVVEQVEEVVSEEDNVQAQRKRFSAGLTMQDVRSIENVLDGQIRFVSPEIVVETYVLREGLRRSAKVVGVENNYFEISQFALDEGKYFNERQLKRGEAVCIIGSAIKTKFFPQDDPLGKLIKVGRHWLKVVGVLEERFISEKSMENLGIRDYNLDIYSPVNTVLLRYKNRALVTQAGIESGNGEDNQQRSTNYHQLDRITIQVKDAEQLNPVADVSSRLLERRHNQTVDYTVTIPELLLKQQQRTRDIFNLVLGAIAGISLVVGGIGIMNIMLASVLERIKEIGLRLAIGAKKADIIWQFLLEAVMISITGGVVGVILGIILATIVSGIAEIPTIVSVPSVILSFGVAAAVGLIFGIAPARRAANQNPIASLRYE
ncbi:MAG: ABC transporter permease [Cyclobacteriaceae bacterium]